jgi:hypothetical protein
MLNVIVELLSFFTAQVAQIDMHKLTYDKIVTAVLKICMQMIGTDCVSLKLNRANIKCTFQSLEWTRKCIKDVIVTPLYATDGEY